MAEAIVSDITSGAVSFLLKKLSEEAGLLVGVRPQVDSLLSDLRWMNAFLKDADTKRGRGGELAKNWVWEVRDAAYRAEDIIDTYMLEIEPRRRRRGLMGHIERYAAFPCELKARHKVVAGLKEVEAKIIKIKASRDTYGMAENTIGQASSSNNKESQQQPIIRKRVTPPYRDDDDDDEAIVVGFDYHKNNILKHLLNTNIRQRCVISVVGIGGIGKTTLANKVYNCSETKSYFEIRACISVSQDHRIGEMLKDIAKHAMGATSNELQSMGIGELKGKVYNFLKGKRYLIVLDDVWSTDAWEETREALPDDKNGSRVMITTRSMEVATSADPTIPPFQLPLLSEEESWELLLKKAFYPDVEPSIPKELEDVGRQLVTRCEGLPLALLVLGGIVNSKKTRNPAAEWRKVGESMNWASTKEGAASLNILRLSIDDLPHLNLRQCFLYLAVFPEDHEIETNDLIRQWVAEGFIPQEQKTMEEDTARDYVEELAHRSMIQVVDKSVGDGCVERFRIHDLFRDLCLREGSEDGFINSYTSYNIAVRRDDGMSSRASESRPPPRRIGLHGVTIDEMTRCYSTYSSTSLRSLSIYHAQVTSEMFGGLKLLRVLHLEDIGSLVKLSEEITSMIHLRYLALFYCDNLRELPSSIGNLRSLQTFMVGAVNVRRAPKSLGRIKTLRHLYLRQLESPPLGNLVNLESLICTNTGGDEGFGKLLNIRDLNVKGLQSAQGTVFLDSLRKLTKLSSLTLNSQESFSQELMTGLSCHDLLVQLSLAGRMPQLGHLFPPNLTELHLYSSKLGQDPMTTLEKLPSLVQLELAIDAYVGELMECTARGFPRLRRLDLFTLSRLEEWRVEDGAMCNLDSLQIQYCGRLRMLPDGLRHLTSLQSLIVVDRRIDFIRRLQQDDGEDWHKIKHVRSIITS